MNTFFPKLGMWPPRPMKTAEGSASMQTAPEDNFTNKFD